MVPFESIKIKSIKTHFYSAICRNESKLGDGFLFAFHYNYDCIFSRFNTIHKRTWQPDTQIPHGRIDCAYTWNNISKL